MRPDSALSLAFDLRDPAATEAAGAALGLSLDAGDAVLLEGPIGAGKSHLVRAAIAARLAAAGAPPEDIPSPTFTLVQTYRAGPLELWHADLYRLTDTAEVEDLGLADAFDVAACLVEWPDRLGSLAPPGALRLRLDPAGEGRRLVVQGPLRWAETVARMQEAADGQGG